MKRFLFAIACITLILACSSDDGLSPEKEYEYFYEDSKPWTRWWWFQAEIKKEDIREQLNWTKANGFGGVEVAWLYPQYYFNRSLPWDTATYQRWLSPEFQEIVEFTKFYCDSIEIGCDFTCGTAWPFGDSYVPTEESTRIYKDTSFSQQIKFSWEYRDYGLVIDHLSGTATRNYTKRLLDAFKGGLEGSRSAMFCDSWEIKLNARNKLWTKGFSRDFEKKFGYDIGPFMEDSLDNFPHVRYDYMQLLSQIVIDSFYIPYHELCNQYGTVDRVQCLASPTDVMTAYSIPDIPETECMLNNPDYSRIVSSAACLSGKREISCETFTCMYGFPKVFNREEQTADLKMVADAMFVNGINQIFWHGMPYNPIGSDSVECFASVHAYKGGNLEDELLDFNNYMARVCDYMKKGKTYSDVAVYIPFEDGVMAGALPEERRRVWIWGEYEMRYIHYPKEVESHHPLWINRHFLERAYFVDGNIQVGDAVFKTLYIDVEWMDSDALTAILGFAKEGFRVCLKRDPKEPGKKKSGDYAKRLKELKACSSVSREFKPAAFPLVTGEELPDYWCKKNKKELYIFFAHPFCQDLAYPIASGQSFTTETITRNITINANGKITEMNLHFRPYQSIMLKISANGSVTQEDIEFIPKDPVVKPLDPNIRMNF